MMGTLYVAADERLPCRVVTRVRTVGASLFVTATEVGLQHVYTGVVFRPEFEAAHGAGVRDSFCSDDPFDKLQPHLKQNHNVLCIF